jgi:hypothetical protein
MYVKSLCESDRWRPSGINDATVGGITAAQRLGVIFLTYMNIYRDSHCSSRQHGQRQKLTEYTIVYP